MLARIREKRLVTGAIAVAAGIGAIMVAAATVEGVAGLFTDQPVIPWFGGWLREWGHEMASVFAVAGLAALTAVLVKVNYRILRLLAESPDDLPAGVQMADASTWLNAGGDMTLELIEPAAVTARSVTFSARQGPKIIVRNKAGAIDKARSVFRLPFAAGETSKLRDGHVILQATITTGEGNRLVTNRLAFKAYGPLIKRGLRR
jgi:hypothetical protein